MPCFRARAATALLCFLLSGIASASTDQDPLESARSLLERNDARGSIALLETALPTASANDRSSILELLRTAYNLAAQQADAAGNPQEAELYRENLAILDRASKPRPNPPAPLPNLSPTTDGEVLDLPKATAQPPRNARVDSPSQPTEASPLKALEPGPIAPDSERGIDAVSTKTTHGPKASTESTSSSSKSDSATAPSPTDLNERELALADASFLAKRYDEAGTRYASLARRGTLPDSRKDAWAYCRRFAVVRRINAPPRTREEWASIHDEILRIRQLSPKNWYDEYLRNLVVERSAQSRKADPKRIILRGASPDDGQSVPSREDKNAPALAPARDSRDVPTSPRRPAEPAPSNPGTTSTTSLNPQSFPGKPAAPFGNWQVWETPNFRILHANEELARRVSRIAETIREEQSRRWTGASPKMTWTPRCDIYLYPTASIYSQMTGQAEESPGFSTSGLMAGRVTARRINLRADHPGLETAILPHEVTHIVLVDLFSEQQIPRWADEGMAVLAEPVSEQSRRASELARPLAEGKLFELNKLMAMDYPDGKHWPLYYAQSISLTRFLVEQGSPAQFIQFVRDTQRQGIEAALKTSYQIDGFADLQRKWLAYARSMPEIADTVTEIAQRELKSTSK